MTEDEQLERTVGCERGLRDLTETATGVARLIRAARIRAAHREPRGPVGMQHAERTDRETIAQHGPQRPISAVLLEAQAVPMFHPSAPATQRAGPRPELEVDTGIAEHVAAPAIVIARQH